MKISESYDYLVRARRDLWTTLENVLDESLSRPLAGNDGFHCFRDPIFHIATVENSWIYGDILREESVLMNYSALRNAEEGAACGVTLETPLDYWRTVERSTLTYLATLTDEDLNRTVTVEDWPPHAAPTV